ncbi:MAG: nitrite reductase [Proteobacteria bacterium]|nr:nitrite reductase [Pseudomonadota bacterium]MBU1688348.1 nitrite reductase [Pseudomonadota bacterium]
MSQKKESVSGKSLTILLPSGRLPGEVIRKVTGLKEHYRFDLYLSTAQNLRLYNLAEEDVEPIRQELSSLGVSFKGPGRFPLARVCIGSQGCNLGLCDTLAFSDAVAERFGSRSGVKPKFKIAVSGCPAACSGPLLTDIGIVATRQGFDVFVGGKGGARPAVGRRIVRQANVERVLEIIGLIADFHAAKTPTKQRMSKLLDEPGFPFPEEV